MTLRLLARPELRFAVHETGALELISGWFPTVVFVPSVVERSHGAFVVQDDKLVITCTNGRAAYALGPPGPDGSRRGHLTEATTCS